MTQDEPVNPYAPTATTEQPAVDMTEDHAKLVKDFRSQSLSLGVLWLIFGSFGLTLIGVAFAYGNPIFDSKDPIFMAFIATVTLFAVAWVVSGVLAVRRQLVGVYVGLGLTYLLLIPNLYLMNLCGIVILLVVLLQSHRVIGFARKMRELNIPFRS